MTRDNLSPMHRGSHHGGFTLIELLVVITIIIILMGLLFPAFRGAQDQAKKAQAKNDLVQIVTAINAFYTEYGQYPCVAQAGAGSEAQDYYSNTTSDKQELWNNLRAFSGPYGYNTRGIPFITPPTAKDLTVPKSGIGGNGIYYDPWGTPYVVRMDNNYNSLLANPYSTNAGIVPNMNGGVIAWSFGKDGKSLATPGPAPDKKAGTEDDDVISWQ